MKVLATRTFSIISARLSLLAFQYNWKVKSEEGILSALLFFISRRLETKFVYNPSLSIINYLRRLPQEILRRLFELTKIVLDVPHLFDKIICCYNLVPVSCLAHYLILDLE